MMNRLMLLAIGQIASEDCPSDDAILMQTKTGKAGGLAKSQMDRLTDALHQTSSGAQFICVAAEAGESAPLPGSFAPQSGAKVAVDVGYVAQEAGEYCVQNSLLSLLQRAASVQNASSFETAVVAKNTDSSVGGKAKKQLCGGANLQCKAAMKAVSSAEYCDRAVAGTMDSAVLQGTGCTGVLQAAAVCNSACPITCKEIVTSIPQMCPQPSQLEPLKIAGQQQLIDAFWDQMASFATTAFSDADCTGSSMKRACK